MLLISDASREDEALDPLFSYKERAEEDFLLAGREASGYEEEDCLNFDDSDDRLYDFESSGKGGVPPQGVKDEDVEILETFTCGEPIAESIAEVAFAEAATAATATTEAASIGVGPVRVPPGEFASAEVTTATSVPPGNDHNFSFSSYFSYIISNFNDFVKTLVLTAPSVGASGEEVVVPLVVDFTGLDYLYNRVIQS